MQFAMWYGAQIVDVLENCPVLLLSLLILVILEIAFKGCIGLK